jgi:hypothetical protein
MTTTLRVYREDGTEVLPGDTVLMAGISRPHVFRAALIESGEAGTLGMIAVDGYPEMFASPYGLTVRAVPVTDDEPAWESAGTGVPGDIQRDIRGPGGFLAQVGPSAGDIWNWLIIDSSDSATVTSGPARDQEAGKQAVLDWERKHGLIPASGIPLLPHVTPPPPVHDTGTSGRPDPDALDEALRLADAALNDPSSADREHEALYRLADAVRNALTPVRGGTDALAAEADRTARTTAPPVPGVTQHTGHTVYAVLGHKPASPGLLESWIVAAADDRGEHVTWNAYASDDGSGRLHYDTGHYHYPGEGTDSEALVDLANRAGVFTALTGLSSGTATREAFTESYAKVLAGLSGVYGVGRARVRAGLLEAAALGYARISWHHSGMRQDYGISYDRVSCTFSWVRVPAR